jgi:hypothetical protein
MDEIFERARARRQGEAPGEEIRGLHQAVGDWSMSISFATLSVRRRCEVGAE